MFKKTITTDFFTTINFNLFLDSFKALTIWLPWLRHWDDTEVFNRELQIYLWLEKSKVISFYNWRSALYHALKIIWVKKSHEIIVNWFTCVSVSNAVIQSWAKIIYSDINKNNYWFDITKLEEKINKKTKVIIVQHTFWKNSNIKKIITLAKKHKILVIEDCAHSLWTKTDKIHLWTFWDFSIFSTWRDKVISSVTWGFLFINNSKYFDKKSEVESQLEYPSRLLTIKNLLYNIIAFKSYKLYDFMWLWKLIIYLSRKMWLITEILNTTEKECNYDDFNLKLPNSLAKIAIWELEKIKFYNNHRRWIWEYYDSLIKNSNIKSWFTKLKTEKNNYFRYPILLKTKEKAEEFYNYMKDNNIILWKSWSFSPIAPIWSNLKNSKYKISENKNAQDISSRLLFLPNHSLVTLANATKIVKIINNYK